MVSVLSWILIIVFFLINSALLYYFVKKYQDTGLRTTLYWVLTYFAFVTAIIFSIGLFIAGETLEDGISIQYPFVLLGLTFLAMSSISTGLLGENSSNVEYGLGTAGLVGFVLYFFGLSSITTIIFILMSLISIIAYFYLAYSGSNYRIAVISIGLLMQALSGRLSVSNVIDLNGQLFVNSLGQLAIGIGLLGIGLKRFEA